MCLSPLHLLWQIFRDSVANECVCMRAKTLQSCLTLCDPMDCSPPGSSVHGILQARIMEWVALFLTQESNWGILHCRQILYQLSHNVFLFYWYLNMSESVYGFENSWPKSKCSSSLSHSYILSPSLRNNILSTLFAVILDSVLTTTTKYSLGSSSQLLWQRDELVDAWSTDQSALWEKSAFSISPLGSCVGRATCSFLRWRCSARCRWARLQRPCPQ